LDGPRKRRALIPDVFSASAIGQVTSATHALQFHPSAKVPDRLEQLVPRILQVVRRLRLGPRAHALQGDARYDGHRRRLGHRLIDLRRLLGEPGLRLPGRLRAASQRSRALAVARDADDGGVALGRGRGPVPLRLAPLQVLRVPLARLLRGRRDLGPRPHLHLAEGLGQLAEVDLRGNKGPIVIRLGTIMSWFLPK
jgi:hypothetical protein